MSFISVIIVFLGVVPIPHFVFLSFSIKYQPIFSFFAILIIVLFFNLIPFAYGLITSLEGIIQPLFTTFISNIPKQSFVNFRLIYSNLSLAFLLFFVAISYEVYFILLIFFILATSISFDSYFIFY